MNWMRIVLLVFSLLLMGHTLGLMVVYRHQHFRLGDLTLCAYAIANAYGQYTLINTAVTSRTLASSIATSIGMVYVVRSWRHRPQLRAD